MRRARRMLREEDEWTFSLNWAFIKCVTLTFGLAALHKPSECEGFHQTISTHHFLTAPELPRSNHTPANLKPFMAEHYDAFGLFTGGQRSREVVEHCGDQIPERFQSLLHRRGTFSGSAPSSTDLSSAPDLHCLELKESYHM